MRSSAGSGYAGAHASGEAVRGMASCVRALGGRKRQCYAAGLTRPNLGPLLHAAALLAWSVKE